MMHPGNLSRRGFLNRSLASLTFGAGLPAWYARQVLAAQSEGAASKGSASDRLVMGIVGIGSPKSRSLGVVSASVPSIQAGQLTYAVGCDVDAEHRERAT